MHVSVFVVCQFLYVCGYSLQHHAILGGGYSMPYEEEDHALYVFAAGARSEPMRATSRHKRRRIHACHMRRRIHARSEPMRARRRTARKQYSKLFVTHDLCVLRICVHVDVRACARAHIYFRTCTFADNFAHIQKSTKVSASKRASSCRPGLGFRVYTHTHTQAHSM